MVALTALNCTAVEKSARLTRVVVLAYCCPGRRSRHPRRTESPGRAQAREWATPTGDGAMHSYVLLCQARATDRTDPARLLDLAHAPPRPTPRQSP
ncbi:hypothetical protein OG275_17290 [Streptomyces niveus]|uniref:hypothetical protein n=1 Tax=Streptomyces niveus TaxID=193462 RepID=UPI002E30E0C2|nr:hypothetical protein [Streptomyces niveus]